MMNMARLRKLFRPALGRSPGSPANDDGRKRARPARFCLMYDCLYPWTIGGAERWYRNLALALARAGHEVTYLTLTQWDVGNEPDLPGVCVVTVGPRLPLYRDGKRRVWPPIRFGIGVFFHLLRHGRRYDRVHTASFPFFSLLAAALVRPLGRFTIAVDWFEVWSRAYWGDYLGRLGIVGWWVQRLCAMVPQTAYSFSELHRSRFRSISNDDQARLLPGLYAEGRHGNLPNAMSPPTIVYAGRFIPEKQLSLLIDALAIAIARHPTLCATLFGQGPDHAAIAEKVAALELNERIILPGFVDEATIENAMNGATAIVQPSAREGYGMVVVEAAARGVPAVVIAGPDNAAAELVDAGQNGFVVLDATPDALADALIACDQGGGALRTLTRDWYARNRTRLAIETSLSIVLADTALDHR